MEQRDWPHWVDLRRMRSPPAADRLVGAGSDRVRAISVVRFHRDYDIWAADSTWNGRSFGDDPLRIVACRHPTLGALRDTLLRQLDVRDLDLRRSDAGWR